MVTDGDAGFAALAIVGAINDTATSIATIPLLTVFMSYSPWVNGFRDQQAFHDACHHDSAERFVQVGRATWRNLDVSRAISSGAFGDGGVKESVLGGCYRR